jgi:hypothetical protein
VGERRGLALDDHGGGVGKRIVADQALDNDMLREIARGKF